MQLWQADVGGGVWCRKLFGSLELDWTGLVGAQVHAFAHLQLPSVYHTPLRLASSMGVGCWRCHEKGDGSGCAVEHAGGVFKAGGEVGPE